MYQKRKALSLALLVLLVLGTVFLVGRNIFRADVLGAFSISGTVYDQALKTPIADAQIMLSSTDSNSTNEPVTARTDSSGKYSISAPSGSFSQILIQKDGFWDLQGSLVNVGGLTSITSNFTMRPGFGAEDIQVVALKKLQTGYKTYFGLSLNPWDEKVGATEIITEGASYKTNSIYTTAYDFNGSHQFSYPNREDFSFTKNGEFPDLKGAAAAYFAETDRYYIFGGKRPDGSLSNAVLEYDRNNPGQTIQVATLPHPSVNGSAVYVPGKKQIYYFAPGSAGSNFFSLGVVNNSKTSPGSLELIQLGGYQDSIKTTAFLVKDKIFLGFVQDDKPFDTFFVKSSIDTIGDGQEFLTGGAWKLNLPGITPYYSTYRDRIYLVGGGTKSVYEINPNEQGDSINPPLPALSAYSLPFETADPKIHKVGDKAYLVSNFSTDKMIVVDDNRTKISFSGTKDINIAQNLQDYPSTQDNSYRTVFFSPQTQVLAPKFSYQAGQVQQASPSRNMTLLYRGRAKTDGFSFQNKAINEQEWGTYFPTWFANPYATEITLGDLSFTHQDKSYNLTEAVSGGIIRDSMSGSSYPNQAQMDTNNLSQVLKPGDYLAFHAKKDGVGVKVNKRISDIAVSVIPIDNLVVDARPVKPQDVWLLSMHPQEGEESSETLAYLDRLDQALINLSSQYYQDNPDKDANDIDIIDYSINGKELSDPYNDIEALSLGNILMGGEITNKNTIGKALAANSDSYQAICAQRARWSLDNASYKIGSNTNQLGYYFDQAQWSANAVRLDLKQKIIRDLTTAKTVDSESLTPLQYIEKNFTQPFPRPSCEKRIKIAFDSSVRNASPAYWNPTTMSIGVNEMFVIAKKFYTPTIIHETLHTLRSKAKNPYHFGGYNYSDQVVFFAYEEGQVEAFTRIVANKFNIDGRVFDNSLYESTRTSLNHAKNLKDLKNWHEAIYNDKAGSTWHSFYLYDYYSLEWMKISKSNPEIFKDFNANLNKSLKEGGNKAWLKVNYLVDELLKDKQVENKPFYAWMNLANRKAFTLAIYYEPELLKKIITYNNNKITIKKGSAKTKKIMKVLVIKGDKTSEEDVSVNLITKGLGNYIYEGLDSLPNVMFSKDDNIIPHQNLRIVAYNSGNQIINVRDYTTNELGEIYLPRYDLATDGRIRYQMTWKRDNEWVMDTDYNVYDSTAGNLGFYGVLDVPDSGSIRISNSDGIDQTALINKGVFRTPALHESDGNFNLSYQGVSETIAKAGNSNYYTVVQTDSAPPAFINEVSAKTISSTSTSLDFSASEPVSGLIEYGETTDFGQIKYFDEIKDRQSIILENLQRDKEYFYRILIVDRAGNYQDVDGNLIKKEGSFKFSDVFKNVQTITGPDWAEVTWETESSAPCCGAVVRYSLPGQSSFSTAYATNPPNGNTYKVVINYLRNHTTYRFNVGAYQNYPNQAIWSGDYNFTTRDSITLSPVEVALNYLYFTSNMSIKGTVTSTQWKNDYTFPNYQKISESTTNFGPGTVHFIMPGTNGFCPSYNYQAYTTIKIDYCSTTDPTNCGRKNIQVYGYGDAPSSGQTCYNEF